ncbi:MAG: MFS transporter [Promethearchaeota archaeon]
MKSPERLYKNLKVYAFFWWGFNGMNFVYLPLYYYSIGFDLAQIFLIGALTVTISLLVGNLWTKISDASGRKKKFIVAGNLVFAGANLFLLLVENFYLVVLYSAVVVARPPSDAFNNALVYQIGSTISKGKQVPGSTAAKIRAYVNYRKYGSVGWATSLPFAGLLIMFVGFWANFVSCAIGFVVVSAFLCRVFDEEEYSRTVPLVEDGREGSPGTLNGPNTREIQVEGRPRGSTGGGLLSRIAALLKNPAYRVLMVLVFLTSIASQLAYTNASNFVNLFARGNFALVGLYYSVGAYLEWPVMLLAARGVEKDDMGWERVLVAGFAFNGFKVLVNPFFVLFDVSIWWILALSSLNGFAFGLRWPATTFGIDAALESRHQADESLGFSLNTTVERFGALLGNLTGALVMALAATPRLGFVVVYSISAGISLLVALAFYARLRRYPRSSSARKGVK